MYGKPEVSDQLEEAEERVAWASRALLEASRALQRAKERRF